MKKEWISTMTKNKRMKLTPAHTLDHYLIVLFLLIPFQFPAWSLIEIAVTGTYSGRQTTEEIASVALIFLVCIFFSFLVQYRRLLFKKITLTYSDEQFQEAVERTVKDLKWHIDLNNEAFFRAHRSWDWSSSWGEMVTIIKGKNFLLVNSICNPDARSSITSWGWNRKNIHTFLEHLTDVLNKQPAKIKIARVTKEWSLKQIGMRLFAYPFCFFLIAMGVYVIFQPSSFRSTIAIFVSMTLAIVYLYTDLKILITKKQN